MLQLRYLQLLCCIFILPEVVKLSASQMKYLNNAKKSVIRFQSDGIARDDTLMRYKNDMPSLKRFSVCFRVRLLQVRDRDSILSYAVQDEGDELYISFSYEIQALTVSCCSPTVSVDIPVPVKLRTWFSLCVAFELDDMKWYFAYGGKIRDGSLPKAENVDYLVRSGGMLIIGQDQDLYNGGFNKYQSFRGDLSDLRIYDYVLPNALMTSYTECSIYINVLPMIDFTNLENNFEIENAETDEMLERTICSSDTNITVIFPELRSFKGSELVCHSSGGKLVVPKNNAETLEIFAMAKTYGDICGESTSDNFWIGVTGDIRTQQWQYYLNDQPVNYTKFLDGRYAPVSADANCISFIGHSATVPLRHGGWVPTSCSKKRCTICYLEKVAVLRVRGLCLESDFDREYFLTTVNGSTSFSGIYYSAIVKNPPATDPVTKITSYGSWTISRLDRPEVMATMYMVSPSHYPIGLNTWQVKNDKCGQSNMSLVITSCLKGQFTCNDGACTNVENKCDFESQCPDGSDEFGCYFVLMDNEYDKSAAPPRDDGNAVTISLEVHLESIRKIDLGNFQFSCETELVYQWTDSRLKFKDINENEELNVVPPEYYPWVPKVEYLGAESTMSEVEVRRTKIISLLKSPPLPDNDAIVQEAFTFDGSLTPLRMYQKLTVTASCMYDLEAFPFDVQTCTLGIVLVGVNKDYVTLIPGGGGITFTGKRRGLEYELINETLTGRIDGNFSGVEVKLTLYSLSTFYVTSAYLPTFIMVLIGYTTLYFPLTAFEERSNVGLTGLLVEATFFSQVSSSVPRTAYLKLIDVWFVYCIISMFTMYLTITVIEFIRSVEEASPPVHLPSGVKKLEMLDEPKRFKISAVKLNFLSRIVYPIYLVVFLIAYAILAHKKGYQQLLMSRIF